MIGAALVGVLLVGATLVLLSLPPQAGQVAWARLDTQDVHSLAFGGDDPNHLMFGHHGGVLESVDGGRGWQPLNVRQDAMSLSVAADRSIVIAGHEVFMASRDDGRTWASIQADLPSLDIHGFTRDPADPARMWAYLAIGGLWESSDYGAHWELRWDDNVAFPIAVREGSTTILLGIDRSGFAVSSDGGRSWAGRGVPPTFPMTSLAATPDGSTIYAGSLDGLYRSKDGGNAWTKAPYTGSAFAIATSADGRVVAVVSQQSEFFRSDDGGATWSGP